MGIRVIELDIEQANVALLHEELKAAVGSAFHGVSSPPLRAIVTADAPAAVDEQVQTLAAAHDPAQLTVMQAALAAAAGAPDRARAIPGWATWDETQALDYIAANVTDLASAKIVLAAMARIILALRDATWPALSVEQGE